MTRLRLLLIAVLAAAGIVGGVTTHAQQQIFCPTRPVGDSTNACASTEFVQQNAGSGGGSPGGSVNDVQFKAGATTFGGSGLFTFLTPNVTIGISGSTNGGLALAGPGGTVIISRQTGTGGYDFIIPVSAGVAGTPLLSGGGSTPLSYGSRTGNTTAFATFSGAATSGDCVNIDASGNLKAAGSGCAGAASLTVGSTAITGGSGGRVLFDNVGVLGEYSISGGGSVAMTISPNFTTPVLGVATATSLNGLGIDTTSGAWLDIASNKTLTANTSGILGGGDNWTLAIAAAKTVTHSATTTFAGVDGKTLTINESGSLNGGAAWALAIAAAKTLTVNTSGTIAGGDAWSMAIAAAKTFTVNKTLTLDGVDGKTLSINNTGQLGAGGSADGWVLSIAANKTLTANSNLTLAGTDGKTLTVHNTAMLAGGDAWILAIAAGKSLTSNFSGTIGGTGGGDAWTLTIAAGKTLSAQNSIHLVGTDGTRWTGASTNMTLAALDIESQSLTGGANVTFKQLSAGNITIDCGARPLQSITANTTAWTITAPTSDGSCILLIANPNSTNAAPTFSGFLVSSNTGTTISSQWGSIWSVSIWRINGVAGYNVFQHK